MINPTSKGARLAAKAISKSFNIKETAARDMLAASFNHNSWDSFTGLIASKGATQNPSPEQIAEAHQSIFTCLINTLDLSPSGYLMKVVESTSPFADNPKPSSYDIATANTPPSDDSIDMSGLFDGIDMNEGMEMMAEMMRSSGLDNIANDIENLGMEGFANKLRISKPVDPFFYNVAMEEVVGWKSSQHTKEFSHHDPVFYWHDKGQEQPVFINGAVIVVGDSGDAETLDTIYSLIDDSFEEDQAAILLFGNVQFKEIKGNEYAIIGQWYDITEWKWRWLFLSKLTPWEQKEIFPDGTVDDLENALNNPTPPAELACPADNNGVPLYLIYHCVTHPESDPSASNSDGLMFEIKPRPVLTGFSGWKTML